MKGISRRNSRIAVFICIGIILLAFMSMLVCNLIYRSTIAEKSVLILSVISCLAGITSVVILFLFVIRVKNQRDSEEIAIRDNEEKYRSIISVSNTGAWEYHSDTEYLWCSPEYFRMLGYDVNNYSDNHKLTVKDNWISFLHPDDKEAATAHFAKYLSGEHHEMYENYFRMKHSNGSWVWIWARGRTLKNADSTLSNITLGTHIDITDKKILEIELLKHNKKLLNYAYLNAHHVRGPVARLLGLIAISRLEAGIDYPWFFEKVEKEAHDIDKILTIISTDLDEISEPKSHDY